MYKYNRLIIKALNILNKLYSSKMNMFNIASRAQVWSANCLFYRSMVWRGHQGSYRDLSHSKQSKVEVGAGISLHVHVID